MRDELDSLLDSQPVESAAYVAHHWAGVAEYGVTTRVDEISGGELRGALEAFGPRGDVLELACGSGMWTAVLAKHASRLTAVDASPRMLKVASWRVRDDRVRFVESDIFAWQPDRRYDVVFFSTWLCWVPPQRFDRFWALVADCLTPTGRVFFIDELPPLGEVAQAIPERLIPLVERSLRSGSHDRAVKVFYAPDELRSRLAQLGWSVAIQPINRRLFYAIGDRATASRTTHSS